MSALLAAEDVEVRLGGRAIVSGVDLRAAAGEIVAVVGPNGSGKSTLLRGCCGLLPLARGSVRAAGTDVHRCPDAERARLLAWVPQQSALAARLTVADVVAMGRFPLRGARPGLGRADRSAIADALARCDVADLADRDFATLSGGERARVLIARALATEAPVLCLDEPTASLDVGHALDCYALCRELADAGRAVVIVLHQLADVRRHTDRCLLIDRGRTVCCEASAIALTPGRVAATYGVAMRENAALTFHRVVPGDGAGT